MSKRETLTIDAQVCFSFCSLKDPQITDLLPSLESPLPHSPSMSKNFWIHPPNTCSLANFPFCVANTLERTAFAYCFHQAPYSAFLLSLLHPHPLPPVVYFSFIARVILFNKKAGYSTFQLSISRVFLLHFKQNLYLVAVFMKPYSIWALLASASPLSSLLAAPAHRLFFKMPGFFPPFALVGDLDLLFH